MSRRTRWEENEGFKENKNEREGEASYGTSHLHVTYLMGSVCVCVCGMVRGERTDLKNETLKSHKIGYEHLFSFKYFGS